MVELKQGSKSTIKKLSAIIAMGQIDDILQSDIGNIEAVLKISQIVMDYKKEN